MENYDKTIQFYDEIVNVSMYNLISFTKRNKRKNYFIPYGNKKNKDEYTLMLYHIEIAKLASTISDYNTITIEVNNLYDFIFLLKMKWKLRKSKSNIKRAKPEDINNDILFYNCFMKEKMDITDNTLISVYNTFFKEK